MPLNKKYVLILGAGKTGLSAAIFLKKNNFKIFDTREIEDLLPEIKKNDFILNVFGDKDKILTELDRLEISSDLRNYFLRSRLLNLIFYCLQLKTFGKSFLYYFQFYPEFH